MSLCQRTPFTFLLSKFCDCARLEVRNADLPIKRKMTLCDASGSVSSTPALSFSHALSFFHGLADAEEAEKRQQAEVATNAGVVRILQLRGTCVMFLPMCMDCRPEQMLRRPKNGSRLKLPQTPRSQPWRHLDSWAVVLQVCVCVCVCSLCV